MSTIHGDKVSLTIFGESHGAAIGMTLDGVPAGLPVDFEQLQRFMDRRAPGRSPYSTPRTEDDIPEFLSGISDNMTNGSPICAIIRNKNTKSSDYRDLMDCPRPGHADYTAFLKYGEQRQVAGGGHFSGRLTAAMCIAGGLCKQWLSQKDIEIFAHIASVGTVCDELFDPVSPDRSSIDSVFPVLDVTAGEKMRHAIESAKCDGDSLGGTIECAVTGFPGGIGGPLFEGLEGKLSYAVFGIPAVKGIEFGSGFHGTTLTGSQNNDPFSIQDNNIVTTTNHAGGILGGISNGMPLLFRVGIKPTPSIVKPQQSVNLKSHETQTLQICGRHDPCIVPRAVPVVEAAAAMVLFDQLINP